MQALDKCHNSILKDKIADPGPGGGLRLAACTTDTKTADKLSKASSKIMAMIAGKCGGANKTCSDFDLDGELSGDVYGRHDSAGSPAGLRPRAAER